MRATSHPRLLGRRGPPAHLLRTGMANTYLLGHRRLVVVDPGAASSASLVLDFVTQELGRKTADIAEIVVTHLHCDHIGGVAELAEATGAKVAMSRAARRYVEGGEPMRWAPLNRWLAMMALWRGTDFRVPSLADLARMPWTGSPLSRRHQTPFRVSRWLADGERVAAEGWRVVSAPGHTDDSICLWTGEGRALVSGDVVLGVHGRPLFNPFFAFDEEMTRTRERLGSLRPARVLPGHGWPTRGFPTARKRGPGAPP